ncbi:MAG TPA: PilZ domain-containing protein [Bdellovibrionales bacterium]|nr:PilZ domain-containing protein [Bdellovibrionales bacterium]
MGAALKLRKEDRVNRSPRYLVRTGEETLLRFSRGGSRRKIAKTKIVNLSDSGMAFHVDGRAIPHLGEIIKVEFELGGRVVRYGRVVRLESPNEDGPGHDIQVAIEFLTEKAPEKERLGLKFHRHLVAIDGGAMAEDSSTKVRSLLVVSALVLVAAVLSFALKYN